MITALTTPIELPVVGETRERADAVRNRALILATAERLFAEHGVDCTSMDAIAAAAGVGKGTLFRRFGDRASLVMSLLGERESAFQESFIRGEPPLGPGAPPVERLVAFGGAVLEHIDANGELVLAAETGRPGQRFRSPVYSAYRAHLRALVSAGAPELDPEYTADALMAMLAAEVIMHQRRGRDIPLADLQAGWEAMVRRVCD